MNDKHSRLDDDLIRQIEAFAEARFREMQERGKWSVAETFIRAYKQTNSHFGEAVMDAYSKHVAEEKSKRT
jgi:hypothetical protein